MKNTAGKNTTAPLVGDFFRSESAIVEKYKHFIPLVEDPVAKASLELLRNGHEHTAEQMAEFLSSIGAEEEKDAGLLQELGSIAENMSLKLSQSDPVQELLQAEQELLKKYENELQSNTGSRAELALVEERVQVQQSSVATIENLLRSIGG